MELLSYEEADIEKYIFVAVLDKRTSRICQEHDNQVYDRDKAVPGVNCPPMHPWCRSTTVAYDEDADYSKLKRRARNPVTGKTELVPADMTYKEWYSKYVAKDGEKVYNQDTREAKAKFYSEQLLSKISGVEPKLQVICNVSQEKTNWQVLNLGRKQLSRYHVKLLQIA